MEEEKLQLKGANNNGQQVKDNRNAGFSHTHTRFLVHVHTGSTLTLTVSWLHPKTRSTDEASCERNRWDILVCVCVCVCTSVRASVVVVVTEKLRSYHPAVRC